MDAAIKPVGDSIWNSVTNASNVDAAGIQRGDIPSLFDAPFQDSNKLLQIGNQAIQVNGGVTDPSALLRTQVQMLSLEMSWLLTAQLANKASSGVQTLFNNQV